MTSRGIEAVLLAGPTASGKSAAAIEIAERFGGEIVNTDSMQVYADLSTITARPSGGDLAQAVHHLYGHVDGAVNHSVGLWRNEAEQVLARLRDTGRLPILVGGTGLYFKAAERGLAEMPSVPDAVRGEVRAAAHGIATSELHARLAAEDPDIAARLRPTDRQRILRAREIFAATGRPLSSWQREPHTAPLVQSGRCLRVFMAPERQTLYARIDRRFDTMMAAGAMDEVAALARRELDPALPVMRAHGVPWLIRAWRGAISLEEAVEASKADTRRYAKRQFTWFRHQMPGWIFVSPDSLLELVLRAIRGDR
jgi:tRNA dimethylallyltransferase